MTLQEAQQIVDNWIKTYGVRYFGELTNMVCLANQTGVDLTDAFSKNIEKKTLRDAQRHIQNKKLY